MRYAIREGNYAKMGTVVTNAGTIFTFEGKKEADCAILLYRMKTGEITRIEVPKEYCIGSLRSCLVEKLDIRHYQYNYEIDGEELIDPYAVRIAGRERWFDTKRSAESYRVRGGFAGEEYDWEGDRTPEIPGEEMVIYKLHVRGFSMDGGARGRKRGTFAAVADKIPYLKELGVTTVEFMPVYEFEEMVIPKEKKLPDYLTWRKNEEKVLKEQGDGAPDTEKETLEEPSKKKEQLVEKVNFWGYVPGNYFAPKASYAAFGDEIREFKELVKELHKNTMECVMEIYFDDKMNQNMMLDVLRFWVMNYHVDGFHLLGNAIPMKAIAQDLILSRTKLFYTGFDPGLTEDKTAYPHLYVYNDEYMYPLRKLLNHIDGNLYEFANQQKKQHQNLNYVNYAAINNSFTLADVFMYSEKHNQENGENNVDGLDWNFSSNYGIEGPTRRKYIQSLRRKQMRNAMAMVCFAQGIPLIASGDEFGNSQDGNNNAYCQDNKTGWINWREAKNNRKFTEYISGLLAFRRSHPVIRMKEPMHMNDYQGIGYPDLSYHCDRAWVVGFEPSRQSTGMMYCGSYADGGAEDDFIYVAYNFHNGKKFLALPKLPKGKRWTMVMDTALEEPFSCEQTMDKQDMIEITGLSIRVLVGK